MNVILPEGMDVHCVNSNPLLAESFKGVSAINGKSVGSAGYRSWRDDRNGIIKYRLFAGIEAMEEVGKHNFRFTVRDVRRKYFSAVYSSGGRKVGKDALLRSGIIAVLCISERDAYIYVASLKVEYIDLLVEKCLYRLPLPRKLLDAVLLQSPVSMGEAMHEIITFLETRHQEMAKHSGKERADAFVQTRTCHLRLMAHAVRAGIMKISDKDLTDDLKLPEPKVQEETPEASLPEAEIVEEVAEPANPVLTPDIGQQIAAAQAAAQKPDRKNGKKGKKPSKPKGKDSEAAAA